MRKFLIALAIFLHWGGAFAQDAVFTDGALTVRIGQGPCLPPVAALVRDEILPKSKAGTAQFEGRTIRLCWAVLTPGVVTIVDEDGDTGPLPMDAFKPAPTI